MHCFRLVNLDDHTTFLVDQAGCVTGILSCKDLLSEQRLLDRIRQRVYGRAAGAANEMADVRAREATLSPRERQVMDGLVRGQNAKEIAGDLSISPKTVEFHRTNVFRKMQVDSVVALVRMVLMAQVAETPAYRQAHR